MNSTCGWKDGFLRPSNSCIMAVGTPTIVVYRGVLRWQRRVICIACVHREQRKLQVFCASETCVLHDQERLCNLQEPTRARFRKHYVWFELTAFPFNITPRVISSQPNYALRQRASVESHCIDSENLMFSWGIQVSRLREALSFHERLHLEHSRWRSDNIIS